MKKVFFPTLQPDPDGRPLGAIMRFVDFLKTQYFLEAGFRDFIKRILVAASTEPQVDGFLATLTAGLGISVAPGLAVDMEGDFYNSPDEATVVVLAAANIANPRIDLIVAKITADVPSNLEAGKKYRELLTYAEVAARVVPLESNHDVNTELWMIADIEVRQGVPGAVPVAPVPADDEIPLWEVRVEAGAAALTVDKLTDRRNLMRSLKDPFDIVEHTGLEKVIGPFGRILLSGLIASEDELGMIKIGPAFTIDPDGTLHSVFENLETLQDALATSFFAVAPFSITYNDAANRWDFDVATATGALRGLISAADQARLNAATSANTASALVQRTSNGDFNGRDIKAERHHVFSDNSIMPSAFRSGDIIPFFEFQDAYSLNGNPNETKALVTTGGQEFEVWVKVEEFVNIPIVFEAVLQCGAAGSINLQLYNATDAVVLAVLGKNTSTDNTARTARSSAFNLSGTGRKRLILRQYTDISNGGVIPGNYWLARLVLNPQFSNCGHSGLGVCPIA